jgi:hypothetical protein
VLSACQHQITVDRQPSQVSTQYHKRNFPLKLWCYVVPDAVITSMSSQYVENYSVYTGLVLSPSSNTHDIVPYDQALFQEIGTLGVCSQIKNKFRFVLYTLAYNIENNSAVGNLADWNN